MKTFYEIVLEEHKDGKEVILQLVDPGKLDVGRIYNLSNCFQEVVQAVEVTKIKKTQVLGNRNNPNVRKVRYYCETGLVIGWN